MSKHDPDRRAFLVNATASAGAIAGAALVPDAIAQTMEHDRKPGADAGTSAQTHANLEGRGAFFNRNDALTVEAFAERIMPGAPGKPGARDAGVLNYIDLALAGAYAELQDFYRSGLAQLDAYCRKTYNEGFSSLDAPRQDEVITSLEKGTANGFAWPTAAVFFNTVRTHTMEGMFADPIYGGNKDFAGWRLVGFPGVQSIYTPADMKNTGEFTRASIIGIQGQSKMSHSEVTSRADRKD